MWRRRVCVCRLAKLVVTPFPSHSQVRTGQVYLRDCAPVSAYALMLFGGDLAGGASQQPPPPSRGVGGRAGGAVRVPLLAAPVRLRRRMSYSFLKMNNFRICRSFWKCVAQDWKMFCIF